MWSAVSNSAYQGKLVRLVHAGTDAESFIAANLRRLRWLVGWISDVERQLPGAHSGNSGGRFRCLAVAQRPCACRAKRTMVKNLCGIEDDQKPS